VIGVLSDTHGHLYPKVKETLEGVDHIIHAGDVGSAHVLTELKAIAPVTAVRGNCDLEPGRRISHGGGVGGRRRPHSGGSHSRSAARPARARPRAPDPSAVRAVVTGHTHRVESEERDGVLHLNPGSAGPQRFGARGPWPACP